MQALTKWCILRTSGGRTIALTTSLAAAGYDVWTPIQTQSRRRPRSKVTIDREMPIMPTFVFARADHLADLSLVLALPINPHPSFSIFHYGGRIPVIADKDIANLRVEEGKAKRTTLKKQRHSFGNGQPVRITEGAAMGLTGVVESGDGKFALVNFGGGLKLKIATWLLRTDALEQGSPDLGSAALAA